MPYAASLGYFVLVYRKHTVHIQDWLQQEHKLLNSHFRCVRLLHEEEVGETDKTKDTGCSQPWRFISCYSQNTYVSYGKTMNRLEHTMATYLLATIVSERQQRLWGFYKANPAANHGDSSIGTLDGCSIPWQRIFWQH